MPLGSGLAAQFGFVSETTYGTAVTVTKFLPLLNETLESQPERVESAGIVAGARVLKSEQWQPGFTKISGDVQLELYQQGTGTLFRHMFGSVTSSATAGNATHTFTPGDLTGQSMTVQIGRPQIGGVVTPSTYAGVKVASWELGVEPDKNITLGLSMIAKSETTGTALASATFLTNSTKAILPPAGIVTVSVSGSSYCVRKLTLAGDNGLADDRMCVGASTIDEPLEAGLREYTGTITMEFSNTAHYQQFLNGGEYPITVNLASGFTTGLFLTMNARFDGGTPNVTGPELIVYDRPFKCIATSLTNDATAIQAVLLNSQTTI
jgi:hypothetical protein